MIFLFKPRFGERIGNADNDPLAFGGGDEGVLEPGHEIGPAQGQLQFPQRGLPELLMIDHTQMWDAAAATKEWRQAGEMMAGVSATSAG